MKKYIIIVLIFLCSCATTQKTYIPPDYLRTTMTQIGDEVLRCIQAPVKFYISPSKEPNAWIMDDKVIFSEGMFKFSNNTLRFVMAHEIAHNKLGHLKEVRLVSYATTGVMMVVNVFIPGTGYLNHLINPAICNNFSKSQELEADKEASKTCLCLGISIEQQIEILETLKSAVKDGGGFWDRHPSWDDRIANILSSDIKAIQ